MSLGPVVAGTALSKNKVIWSENLSERARSDTVHGSRLQVHKDGSGYILATAGLIIVYVYSLKLEV